MSILDKAADLVDLLITRGGAMRLNEFAEGLGAPKSTTHRLCAALVDIGVLRRDDDGAYGKGPRLISWALAFDPSTDLAALALPVMRRLGEASGEAISLHIPSGRERICIAAISGQYALAPVQYVGMRRPMGLGASGKALLAYARPDTMAIARAALTFDGYPIPTDEGLEAIRREGWATSQDEQEAGLSAAGAPIFDRKGEAVAVVTVAGSTARLSLEALAELRRPLQECAGEITSLVQGGGIHGERFARPPGRAGSKSPKSNSAG